MTKKTPTITPPMPPLVLPGRPIDPGIKNVGEGSRPTTAKPGSGRGGGGTTGSGGSGGSGTGSGGGGSGGSGGSSGGSGGSNP